MRLDVIDLDAAADLLVSGRSCAAVHLCNAYTISLADSDVRLVEALNRGSMNLIDGAPLMWFARRRTARVIERRPSGPDVMQLCLDRGRGNAVRHYLYGSTPDVLEAMTSSIGERWPGTLIVGAESPPFRDLDADELSQAVERIGAVAADIVWVGLGTPKQDFVVDQMASLDERTYVAIGAAFDFIAGTKRRAPRWMQRLGLEWVFRLAIEPRRLWKRYLVGNAKFLWILWKFR